MRIAVLRGFLTTVKGLDEDSRGGGPARLFWNCG